MNHTYQIIPVNHNGRTVDFEIVLPERKFRLMGRFAEKLMDGANSALSQNTQSLPVLIGSGSKEYLEFILSVHKGPLAIVDREDSIMDAVEIHEVIESEKNRILLIKSGSVEKVLSELTEWQTDNRGKSFLPIVIPAYLRIDQDFYKPVVSSLKVSHKYNFWDKARYSRFQGDKPRILLITTNYFLMGEIIAACDRQDIPHHFLNLENQEVGKEDFVRDFLQAVLEFKPDFVFTINHLGLDREGVLMDLLDRMDLPLASWFVDNPHLILYLYENLKSPFCSIFTWDADNIQSLKSLGFEKVFYLPLATDSHRFSPGKKLPGFSPQARDISFVGNSMVHKVKSRLGKLRVNSGFLADNFHDVAESFAGSHHNLIYPLLSENFSEHARHFDALPSIESKLDFETLVTWEATRIYRKKCVENILPFHPLIAGDDGWKSTFPVTENWDYHPELNYYDDLPGFYPHARINFNTTSAQMKGAVNQRVFDVPACGAFLVTDYRKQIENLLEPEKEVVFYKELEEIEDILRFFLKNPGQRKQIVDRARTRILSEHTYDHRLLELCSKMKMIYG
ncbi:MAG: glycosyltransferase [Desulfonatronovibrio sp.]